MKIVYKNDAGGISVIHPTGELTIEEVARKDVPKGVAYEFVDDDAIPSDRTFRGAWEIGLDKKITNNFTKAQDITKERLRVERQFLLESQDIKFQRALEEGKDTALIVAEKQRLRDITTLADKAKTLDELKAIKV